MTGEPELRDLIELDSLTLNKAPDGGLDLLREFDADILLYEEADGDPKTIGNVKGLVGWRINTEDLWDATDAISADVEPLGGAANEIREWLAETEDVTIDSALFIELVQINKDWRGHRLSGVIIEKLVSLMRLAPQETIVVLTPEPQMADGGPMEFGPARDAAIAKLRAAYEESGFQRWAESGVWWLLASDLELVNSSLRSPEAG